jgi:acetoin:2,6-dichlorophenolindophenol oxidoreductase subunit alpha
MTTKTNFKASNENTEMMGIESGLSNAQLLDMYSNMHRIRIFNDRQVEESKLGKIFGYVHLYTGQEAVAVGSIAALETGDKITSTHRAEGHLIAAGVPVKTIMAECFGRVTGVCGGRGGPMGLAAVEYGIVSAYEIVGGGIGVATGIALAFSLQKKPSVVLCFFGDGAANRGVLYECLNMAALWKLPIIYICENNGYAVDTSVERAFANPNIAGRASGFGLLGIQVNGTDILSVYKKVREARERAISGKGPTFIEMIAPRWCGHHLADPQWYYRSREEVNEERKCCPIEEFRKTLLDQSIMNEEQDLTIRKNIVEEVNDAVLFAEASDWPDEGILNMNLFNSIGED